MMIKLLVQNKKYFYGERKEERWVKSYTLFFKMVTVYIKKMEKLLGDFQLGSLTELNQQIREIDPNAGQNGRAIKRNEVMGHLLKL